MSDLDRYLTDESVEKAARTEWEYEWPDRSWERVPDDIRDFYMSVARASLSAVLPDIIQQAKVEALREAAQKYLVVYYSRTDTGRGLTWYEYWKEYEFYNRGNPPRPT